MILKVCLVFWYLPVVLPFSSNARDDSTVILQQGASFLRK